MKFRLAIFAACAGMFSLVQVQQADAGCFSPIGGGVYQICQRYCVRYVDGIPYLAPCLKVVKEVEDAIVRHKSAGKK